LIQESDADCAIESASGAVVRTARQGVIDGGMRGICWFIEFVGIVGNMVRHPQSIRVAMSS
jgi:hypothetical protein